MPKTAILFAAGACAAAAPAAADVIKNDPGGFVTEHKLVIAAPPAKVWATIARPAAWWSSGHTYSGDAANISVDTRPGGCWCEKIGDGAIEHMRTLYVQPGKVLRFSGALGPLQSGAVTGTLTFELKPQGTGTGVTVTYVVGGWHPAGLGSFATIVDGVVGAQWAGLKKAAEAP